MVKSYIEICKAKANTLFNSGITITVQYIDEPNNRVLWEYEANNKSKSDSEDFKLDLQSKGCSNERVAFFVEEKYIAH